MDSRSVPISWNSPKNTSPSRSSLQVHQNEPSPKSSQRKGIQQQQETTFTPSTRYGEEQSLSEKFSRFPPLDEQSKSAFLSQKPSGGLESRSSGGFTSRVAQGGSEATNLSPSLHSATRSSPSIKKNVFMMSQGILMACEGGSAFTSTEKKEHALPDTCPIMGPRFVQKEASMDSKNTHDDNATHYDVYEHARRVHERNPESYASATRPQMSAEELNALYGLEVGDEEDEYIATTQMEDERKKSEEEENQTSIGPEEPKNERTKGYSQSSGVDTSHTDTSENVEDTNRPYFALW